MLPPFRNVASRPAPLRLFFGALNRQEDWAPYIAALNNVIGLYPSSALQVHVVFDRAFFDRCGAADKRFYPLVPYKDYNYLLAKADIAWLPMQDNAFSRAKSDLKFIECAAN